MLKVLNNFLHFKFPSHVKLLYKNDISYKNNIKLNFYYGIVLKEHGQGRTTNSKSKLYKLLKSGL